MKEKLFDDNFVFDKEFNNIQESLIDDFKNNLLQIIQKKIQKIEKLKKLSNISDCFFIELILDYNEYCNCHVEFAAEKFLNTLFKEDFIIGQRSVLKNLLFKIVWLSLIEDHFQ